MKKRLFGFLVFLMPQAGFAQQEDSLFIKRISDEILLHSQAYNNLRELTKTIGGRLSGSPQMVKAEEWGLNKMQKMGADKSWLQACMVPHWVRGGKDECIANLPAKDSRAEKVKVSLDVLALGNSVGTGTNGVNAEVIEVKSYLELEAKKDLVRGKIVFYNYPFDPSFVNTFQSYEDAVRYRGGGPSQAARYGAVAVIVRSMTHSTDNNPHTGATHYDSLYAKIPAVAVGLKDANFLSSVLEKNSLHVFLKTNAQFLPDTIGHNVIGELSGSEFPDQYITVGGHLDSWDPGEGAHDDGAGVVQTMEILRAFKSLGFKPRHTIRFVLFANEENGQRGGGKYAEEAVAKNEKHLFALESDAGGFTPRGFGFDMSVEQLRKIQPWSGLLSPYGADKLQKGSDGTDIGPLKKAFGIPTAGLEPDSQRYFDYHHARSDVFENVNKRELELGAVNMAALLFLVDKYGL